MTDRLELVPTMDTSLTYGLTTKQVQELSQPLDANLIRERKVPNNKMLKYITGKTAIDTANRIFGIGRWGYRVIAKSRETTGERDFYTADIELYVLGCPFPFPGEGVGIPLNATVEQHEKARKEAVTDALKRALRHFGDQFGLALYDEESLVEDADGHLVKVKDVHPGQGASRGVVESRSATSEQAAEIRILQKRIDAAKSALYALYPSKAKEPEFWKTALMHIFEGNVPEQFREEDLTRIETWLLSKRKEQLNRTK